jgi:hypothetical protein
LTIGSEGDHGGIVSMSGYTYKPVAIIYFRISKVKAAIKWTGMRGKLWSNGNMFTGSGVGKA